MAKYTAIGGQALIEGILMRSPEKTALAVRKPDKEISITYLNSKSLRDRFKILRIPVIRGVVAFAESMIQGYKAMMMSAEISGYTDIEDDDPDKTEEQKNEDKKKTGALINAVMVLGSVLGVALAVALFIFLPRLAVDGLEALFGVAFPGVAQAAIAQIIKIIVLVTYMWSVSLMPDIKRVFMYHGAEHKTIFCYEKGLELSVENVRKQKRFHPRCGTSFLILMVLVSVLVQILLHLIPGLYEIRVLWVAMLILMIPVVCGIGFEVLRFCGKYDNTLTKILSAPGLWLQRITTKEPADEMIELAIAALRAAEPENPDVDRSIDERADSVGE